jgi:addiction module RelE/StbE family toxin
MTVSPSADDSLTICSTIFFTLFVICSIISKPVYIYTDSISNWHARYLYLPINRLVGEKIRFWPGKKINYSYKKRRFITDKTFHDFNITHRIQAAHVRGQIAMCKLNKGELENPKSDKPLKGRFKGIRSLRVGKYLIVYDIQENHLIIVVIAIGNRKNVIISPERAHASRIAQSLWVCESGANCYENMSKFFVLPSRH